MSELSPLQELLSVSASKYFDDYTIKKSEKYLLGVRIPNYHVVDNSFIMANILALLRKYPHFLLIY